MKFFEVHHSHDLKIIGTTGPQIQGIDPRCDYHVDAPFSYRKIKHRQPIEEHIRIPDMLLPKKAKWTDLMSNSMMGYLFRFISNDFYDFLSDFKLDEYQTMDIKLTKKELTKEYKALYFPKGFEHTFINWEECSFGLVDGNYAPKKEILESFSFQNADEYMAKYIPILRERKFKFKNLIVRYNRNMEMDFFKCTQPDSNYYCSERLKEGIDKSGFTGFRFVEVQDIEEPYWSIDHMDKA